MLSFGSAVFLSTVNKTFRNFTVLGYVKTNIFRKGKWKRISFQVDVIGTA